jgi:hypothetical protein
MYKAKEAMVSLIKRGFTPTFGKAYIAEDIAREEDDNQLY